MKKALLKVAVMLLCLAGVTPAMAQFNLKKAVGGAVKAAKAVTLTDEQMTEYVKEYIDWMDKHNQVCADDDPYTVRLKKLTEGLTEVEGMPLNFKVYYVIDVNAFACADGSVRVFSSLMDIMTDEELLGVIGHEVGHVAHKDSKNGFRTALLTSALKDGISSQGGKAAALTDSQLGDLGEALVNATYSQKQERAADDYGYEFLKKAGKNPWAMALSFQKLKKLQEEAGAKKSSKLNQLFSTHPDLDARIQRMEERATSEGIEKTCKHDGGNREINGFSNVDYTHNRGCPFQWRTPSSFFWENFFCNDLILPPGGIKSEFIMREILIGRKSKSKVQVKRIKCSFSSRL